MPTRQFANVKTQSPDTQTSPSGQAIAAIVHPHLPESQIGLVNNPSVAWSRHTGQGESQSLAEAHVADGAPASSVGEQAAR